MSEPEELGTWWSRVFGGSRVPPKTQQAVQALTDEVERLREALADADEHLAAARRELHASKERESNAMAQSAASNKAAQTRIRMLENDWQGKARSITEQARAQAEELGHLETANASLRMELAEVQRRVNDQEFALSSQNARLETAERQAAQSQQRLTQAASESAQVRRQADLLPPLSG